MIAISPQTLSAPSRGRDLEIKATAPITGHDLPIVLLSHGDGTSLYLPSLHGYAPLADFWAARGFVVIQPKHLNSKIAGLPMDAPGGPLFWRSGVQDGSRILDALGAIEAQVPTLAGRMDHERVAVAGHSLGGQTAGMLLGARLTDPNDAQATDVDPKDERITAGVLLAAPGTGGADLTDATAAKPGTSFLSPGFSHLMARALVVAGDEGRGRDAGRGSGSARDGAADDVGVPAQRARTRGGGLGDGVRGAEGQRRRARSGRAQVSAICSVGPSSIGMQRDRAVRAGDSRDGTSDHQ